MTAAAEHPPREKPTRRRIILLAAAAVVSGLVALGAYLAASGSPAESAGDEGAPPAVVEPTGTPGVSRVVVSVSAAERLGIQTAPVSNVRVHGQLRAAIPYSAVLYDTDGSAWAYTSPEPRVFVRQDIEVERVDGGTAILAQGPPTGAAVVTVGATELWGVEYGEIEED